MSVPRELSPREFLRSSAFSPDRAKQRFPGSWELTRGGLFISHSGNDTVPIREKIVQPVVFPRLPGDGYFMHSRISGGAESYRLLVQAALHWCDKFMVVISKSSVKNEWVSAEVEWALDRSRPILAVRLDTAVWADLMLPLGRGSDPPATVQLFDFSSRLETAQRHLARALDTLLATLPRFGRSTSPIRG